jgi:Leucine-rich repeat (LRR) protein
MNLNWILVKLLFSFALKSGFNRALVLDRAYLESVYGPSFVNATSISLTRQDITSIAPDTFVGLKRLENLELYLNEISFINASTFNDLINLQNLYLSSNQLYQIEETTFGHLTNLVDLRLSENYLTYIPRNTFANNFNLKYYI